MKFLILKVWSDVSCLFFILYLSVYININVIYSVILLLLLYFYYKKNMILTNVLSWKNSSTWMIICFA